MFRQWQQPILQKLPFSSLALFSFSVSKVLSPGKYLASLTCRMAQNVLELSRPYFQSHTYPLPSPVSHSPTSKTFRQSSVSHSLHSSLSCAVHLSGLRRPMSHIITRPARLSQFSQRHRHFAQHQHIELLTSSSWFPERMCQAPEAFAHLRCKNVSTTSHDFCAQSQQNKVAEIRPWYGHDLWTASGQLWQIVERRWWRGIDCGTTMHGVRVSSWRQAHSVRSSNKTEQERECCNDKRATQSDIHRPDSESAVLCARVRRRLRRLLCWRTHNKHRGTYDVLNSLGCQL